MASSERQHPDPLQLLAFCRRPDQSSDYVRRTAEWVREKYPGSATALLPELRRLYRDKRRAGQ